MTRLLAVDGNSLAHRAYHALVRSRPTGAWVTRGVLRMLASAWIEGPYDGIVMAFDSPDNRRKEWFPEYKANRSDKDPELYTQLDQLRAHTDGCGFTVVEEDGAEADDLLAATADAATERGWRCDVLSSDRDLMALVTDQVRLLRPRATMADLRVYEPGTVEREFGVRPSQYTDFAALRGDPSDGLDGAHGIGPKTAARLLRDYGDVPGIFAALPNLPTTLERALRAGREKVERNLLLMAPLAGLSVDVDRTRRTGVDLEAITATLTRLGEARTAEAFRHAVQRPAPPPLAPPPVEEPAEVDLAAPVRRPAPVTVVEAEQDALF